MAKSIRLTSAHSSPNKHGKGRPARRGWAGLKRRRDWNRGRFKSERIFSNKKTKRLQRRDECSLFVLMSEPLRNFLPSEPSCTSEAISQATPALEVVFAAPGPVARHAAAAWRGTVARLLRRLAQMSATLGAGVGRAARNPASKGGRSPRDMRVAWLLVARASRWIRALQKRLDTETLAAARAQGAAGASELRLEREGLTDPLEATKRQVFERRVRRPRPDDILAGRPEADVVAHICADLGAVARLLGSPGAAQCIAALAYQATTLLDAAPDAADVRATRPDPGPSPSIPWKRVTGGAGDAPLASAAANAAAPEI